MITPINSLETHRFAACGLSFEVPLTWELSRIDPAQNTKRIEMEDDVARRLELEWTPVSKRTKLANIQARYQKSSKKLIELAEENQQVQGIGKDWTAFLYRMPDQRRLLTAFYFSPETALFCFFWIHLEPGGRKKALAILELLTSTFRVHARGSRPWEIYDINFNLDAGFGLKKTMLEAGKKYFNFQWCRRPFHLWFFSLADRILKESSPAAWTAAFLNRADHLQGPTFLAGKDGSIVAKRRYRYPLGYFSEISRLCFRYKAGWKLIENKNQLVVWVYNYRKKSDLKRMEGFEV